jgi:tRNA 2-selenouridine synthase
LSTLPDYSRIFLEGRPLIDVRAPVEFAVGHFPRSVNLPLMTDDERHQVGIEYKERGQAAAIELGHRLVGGDVKAARVARWQEFMRAHPGTMLYCFRGGLRSEISAQWLREAGTPIEFVPGGYKALRRFLMEQIENVSRTAELIVVAGRTGSGKTRFLHSLGSTVPSLDLEGLARHRGSAFGAMGPLGTQPAQVTFENAIAIELLQAAIAAANGAKSGAAVRFSLVVEDESRSIGALQLPMTLFESMSTASLVLLDRPIEERVAAITQEYVLEKTASMGGDPLLVRDFLVHALDRIAKKLGELQHQRIRKMLVEAFGEDGQGAFAPERHLGWVTALLEHYYDPLYDRTLVRREERILFRGNEAECREFLQNR